MNQVKRLIIRIEAWLLGFKKKRDVLFVVHNRIMYSYVQPVYQALKNDKHLRLWFCYPWPHLMNENDFKDIERECRPRIVSYKIAKYIKWNLILFPDHQPYFRSNAPKIYIGHGLEAGKKVGNEHYTFSDRSRDRGKMLYEKIFISSDFIREKVKIHYPDFYPVVRVTGNILLDELRGFSLKKDHALIEAGLDKTKKTVMFVSSWGPHCLIQSRCEEVLEQVRDLARDYNVILSIHLNNYVARHSPKYDFQKILKDFKVKNTHIVKRAEGPFKWLGATDILITDFTSTSLYFASLERPILYYHSPTIDFARASQIQELREVVPNITDLSGIRAHIETAIRNFNPEPIRLLASKIASHQGTALERYKQEIYESLELNWI